MKLREMFADFWTHYPLRVLLLVTHTAEIQLTRKGIGMGLHAPDDPQVRLVIVGQGLDDFRKATDEVNSQIRKAARVDEVEMEKKFSIRVFVAQGFGVGKIPFAPGTFGSLLGLLWLAMLLATGNFWAYLAGAIEGIALSIWLCDDAEKILGEKDPGSVVLDEIIAIPFCFLPWVASEWWQGGLPPEGAGA